MRVEPAARARPKSRPEEGSMTDSNPRSTASLLGHPLHPMLVPFPIVFFISALATDLVHCARGTPIWATASVWLLAAGLAGAVLAALAGLTDFLGDRRIRQIPDAWAHLIGNVTIVLIEAVNLLLRLGATDQVTTVQLVLSALAVALLSFTSWKGGELVFGHGVAVRAGGEER
jgi:uncharacterized membrane protein